MSVDEIRARIVAKLRSLPWRNAYVGGARFPDPEIERHNAERLRWQCEAGDFNKSHPELRITPEEVVTDEPAELRATSTSALPPAPRLNCF